MLSDEFLRSIFFGGNRDWVKRARCLIEGKPKNYFFDKATQKEAKAFCEPCPVRKECLHYADTVIDIDLGDTLLCGVWGALNGPERARRRKEMGT